MRRPVPRRLSPLEKEWITCPRCKTISLQPDVTGSTPDGSIMVWWMCPNFVVCSFPLDMPPNIFQVIQSPQQALEGYYPLPLIKNLAMSYRYMYPITFQSSTEPRCPSVASVKTSTCDSGVSNSSNERSDCVSEPGMSEGSSIGANRLKSVSVSVQPEIITDAPDAPSTSGQNEASSGAASDHAESDSEQEDDDETHTTPRKKAPKRVVKRAVHAPKSWMKLIEDIAKDGDAFSHMLSLGLPVLVERLKHVISNVAFRKKPIPFTRKTRYTYQPDELDVSLGEFPLSVDWVEARKRLTEMSSSYDNTLALKQASGQGLLNMVGVDAQVSKVKLDEADKRKERRSAQLKQMIEQALTKLSRENSSAAENEVKRRRIEEEDALRAGRTKMLSNKAKMSARARVMNILKEKSQSMPSTSSTVKQYQPQAPVPVQPKPVLDENHGLGDFGETSTQQPWIPTNELQPVQFTLGPSTSTAQPWIPTNEQQQEQPVQFTVGPVEDQQQEPDPFGDFGFDSDQNWLGGFDLGNHQDPNQNQNHPTTSYAQVQISDEPEDQDQDQNPLGEFDFHHDDDMFAGLETTENDDNIRFDNLDNIDTSPFDTTGNDDDFMNNHFGF